MGGGPVVDRFSEIFCHGRPAALSWYYNAHFQTKAACGAFVVIQDEPLRDAFQLLCFLKLVYDLAAFCGWNILYEAKTSIKM